MPDCCPSTSESSLRQTSPACSQSLVDQEHVAVPPTTADQQVSILPPILQSPLSSHNDSVEPQHVTFPASAFNTSVGSGQPSSNALLNLPLLHQQALNPPQTGIVKTPPSTNSGDAADDPYWLQHIVPQTPLSIDGNSLSQYKSTKVSL